MDTDSGCGLGERPLSHSKQINFAGAKCFYGSGRQLRDGTDGERGFIFHDAPRKNFSRGVKNKLGLRVNGLIDNGSGGGVHNDLPRRRRAVDGVADCKYFNRGGNVGGRRNFLSRANFLAKNFRRGVVYRGRRPALLKIKAVRGQVSAVRKT